MSILSMSRRVASILCGLFFTMFVSTGAFADDVLLVIETTNKGMKERSIIPNAGIEVTLPNQDKNIKIVPATTNDDGLFELIPEHQRDLERLNEVVHNNTVSGKVEIGVKLTKKEWGETLPAIKNFGNFERFENDDGDEVLVFVVYKGATMFQKVVGTAVSLAVVGSVALVGGELHKSYNESKKYCSCTDANERELCKPTEMLTSSACKTYCLKQQRTYEYSNISNYVSHNGKIDADDAISRSIFD